jgi:hypothetical protein
VLYQDFFEGEYWHERCQYSLYGGIGETGDAPDCDSGNNGFESRIPPQVLMADSTIGGAFDSDSKGSRFKS